MGQQEQGRERRAHARARPAQLRVRSGEALQRDLRAGRADPNASTAALPAVRLWLTWNEPGNPIFLTPQYKRVGTGKKRHWVAQSPIDYARMCAAVYTGVHATLLRNEKVGCGATGPRGNNNPSSARTSIGPLPFLRGVKKAGLKKFDAWAHHPYYGKPKDTPASKPVSNRGKRGRIAPPVVWATSTS